MEKDAVRKRIAMILSGSVDGKGCKVKRGELVVYENGDIEIEGVRYERKTGRV
jgi:hypothetical protein